MKRFLPTLLTIATLAISMTVNGQQRMTIYEEFTGASCGPCANVNPYLDGKAEQNPDKMILIKYINSAGGNTSLANICYNVQNGRKQFYNHDGSAPVGFYDGTTAYNAGGSYAGYPGDLSQTDINNQYNVPAPFNINVTSFSISGGQLSANIDLQAVNGGNFSNVKMFAILVETLHYSSPPGNNGETHFPNTAKKAYPNNSGTSIQSSWSSGQTRSYSISGTTPSNFSTSNDHALVIIVQRTTDRVVLNAFKAEQGVAPPPCNAPASLSAYNVSSSSATVAWGSVSTAQGYVVEYKTSSSYNWTPTTQTSGTSKGLSGLNPGTTYNWRVKSICSSNESSSYAQGSFTTTALPCNPPSNLDATNITDNSVTVSWSPSNTANQGYVVEYRSATSGNWTVLSPTNSTSRNISGLSPSTNYYWRVKTVCGSNSQSIYSERQFQTSAPPCFPPSGLNASSITNSSATVSWSASSSSNQGYRLEYKSSASSNWTVHSTNYTTSRQISGLNANTTYSWRVRTNCSSANSSSYVSSSFTTDNPCFAGTVAPVLSKNSLENICPSLSVNLNEVSVTNNTPNNSVFEWHSSPNVSASNVVQNPANITISGNYYGVFYDAQNNCYSPISNPVVVAISNCLTIVNDTIEAERLAGEEAGIIGNVRSNDNLNGNPVNSFNTTLTYTTTNATNPLSMNTSTGDVLMAPNAELGTYGLEYTLCEKYVTPANCGSGQVQVKVVTPLPVKLGNFDIKKTENDEVNVLWSIIDEKDALKYVVEYSLDGKKFDDLFVMYPNGTKNYQYLHKQPVKGHNYYRVRLEAIDSEEPVYSGILMADFSTQSTIRIYPNPAKGELYVNLLNNTTADIKILSIDGRVVLDKQLKGQNHKLNTSSLSNGNYFVKIYTEGNVFVSQLIIAK